MSSNRSASFAQSLEAGQIGEGLIARWLIRRGSSVLPAYQIEIQHGKGPRFFTPDGVFVSPDLLVFSGEKVTWIEAKTKSAFTWHRISRTWQTGIDLRHWHDYVKVDMLSNWPVWLMFLQRPGVAKDTPPGMVCPAGLFGNEVSRLVGSVHHEHEGHGPSGMVYWTDDALKKLADISEF